MYVYNLLSGKIIFELDKHLNLIKCHKYGNMGIKRTILIRRFEIGTEKLQNWVKAVIAFVCTTCKKETSFVCTIAVDNFCLHYCNWQLFYAHCNWQLLNAILYLLTFVFTRVMDNFYSHYFCTMQMMNFLSTTATDN